MTSLHYNAPARTVNPPIGLILWSKRTTTIASLVRMLLTGSSNQLHGDFGGDMDFDQLFGNTGDGVYVVDTKGIVQYWNSAAEKILGHSAQNVVGVPCYSILNGRDGSCNRICRERCAVQMQVSEGEPINHFEM